MMARFSANFFWSGLAISPRQGRPVVPAIRPHRPRRRPPMARRVPPSGQRGAALLTVLILVAVIAVLAATALEKLRLATRLGGNAVAIEQARGFAYAAEALAMIRIGGLLQQAQGRVSLLGGWSDRPFALPLGGMA